MTKRAVDARNIPSEKGGERPDGSEDSLAPNLTLGPYEARNLGDHFGLTHFGVAMETLAPGSKSSMRHWHTKSDEFILMMEGQLVLVTDEGETTLAPGMVAGFKAGDENAHHLINRTDASATFLVVGSRMKDDEPRYPDDDFQWLFEESGARVAARKDGKKY